MSQSSARQERRREKSAKNKRRPVEKPERRKPPPRLPTIEDFIEQALAKGGPLTDAQREFIAGIMAAKQDKSKLIQQILAGERLTVGEQPEAEKPAE